MEGGKEVKHKKTKHNKTAKVSHEKKPIVLLLHASWCGHCQRLMPEWEKMENEIHSSPLNGKVEIVKIESENMDAELPKYKAMTQNKNIPMEGYPTIAMIRGGNVITYGGERSAENIKNWIQSGGQAQMGGKAQGQMGGKAKANKTIRRKKTKRSRCKSCKSGFVFNFFK